MFATLAAFLGIVALGAAAVWLHDAIAKIWTDAE